MRHLIIIAIVLLLTGLMVSAFAETQLSVRVYPEEVSIGRYIQVRGSLDWDAPDMLTDVYLGVVDSSGAMRFISQSMSDPSTGPSAYIPCVFFAEGEIVADYFLGAFLGHVVAFSSEGDYSIVLALSESGSFDLACQPAFADFRFVADDPSQIPDDRVWTGPSAAMVRFTWDNDRWHLIEAEIDVVVSMSKYDVMTGGWHHWDQTHYSAISGDWRMDQDGCGEVYAYYSYSSGGNWYVSISVDVYPTWARISSSVQYATGSCKGSGDTSADVEP